MTLGRRSSNKPLAPLACSCWPRAVTTPSIVRFKLLSALGGALFPEGDCSWLHTSGRFDLQVQDSWCELVGVGSGCEYGPVGVWSDAVGSRRRAVATTSCCDRRLRAGLLSCAGPQFAAAAAAADAARSRSEHPLRTPLIQVHFDVDFQGRPTLVRPRSGLCGVGSFRGGSSLRVLAFTVSLCAYPFVCRPA